MACPISSIIIFAISSELEDSINSFDAYRLQVNQSIIEIREKLNNLELKILDSQNE